MAEKRAPARARRSRKPEPGDDDDGPEERLQRALGERIRSRREDLGLTQEALAHGAGRDRSYVSELERGTFNIGVVNLAYVAYALDTDLGELARGLVLDPFEDP